MKTPKITFLKSVGVVLLILVIGTSLVGSGIAPSAYNLIENAGSALTQRSTLNFVNGGCADNSGSHRTDCTVITSIPANVTCTFSSVTTEVCTHNLNTTAVLVSVYDSSSPPNLIIPTTEQVTSVNAVTVTFSASQSGTVVVSGSSGSGAGGGSPGGSTSQWQYNNAGSFGGLVGTSIIPQTGWSTFNASPANLSYNDFSSAWQGLHVPNASGLELTGITRSLPSSTSYTEIATIEILGNDNDVSHDAFEGDLIISDGTKYITLEVLTLSGASNPALRLTQWNTATTQNGVVAGPTSNIVGNFVTLKIVGDSVHRTYYYWSSGSFVQFYQEAIGTFLTETTGGLGVLALDSVDATGSMDGILKYWALTSP